MDRTKVTMDVPSYEGSNVDFCRSQSRPVGAVGTGNRMLVKGGRFDRIYKITVPENLNGV